MQAVKQRWKRGRGFTLIEMLVVISIIVILAALLFPIFAQVREKGRQTRCISNLKQISMAVLMYADDHDGVFPRDLTRWGDLPATDPCSTWNPNGRLAARLAPYIPSTEVFACPSANTPPVTWDNGHLVCARDGWGYPDSFCFRGDPTRGKPLSYGWNQWVFQLSVHSLNSGCDAPVISLAAVESPGSMVMVADSRVASLGGFALAFANYPGESAFFASNISEYWPEFSRHQATGVKIVPARDARHHMGQNAAFFDGHVRWLPYQQFTGPAYLEMVAKWFDH